MHLGQDLLQSNVCVRQPNSEYVRIFTASRILRLTAPRPYEIKVGLPYSGGPARKTIRLKEANRPLKPL